MWPAQLGGLVDAFGPFIIPVVVFGFGLAGYGFLLLLNRLRSGGPEQR
jgi:hypothetical protein